MSPVVCSPSGPSSRQSERRVLQQEERWLVLTKVLKKQGHRSQSHTLHGGVTPATNGNHPASSPLCLAAILALSCACLGSKVKTIWTDRLCAAMWPRLEEYRKHCLSIHSWCHQTYSRYEFGPATQIPACNLGLFLTVADCCNMG